MCIWHFGENPLYARMFSYFHERTGFIELMPATAAAYFSSLSARLSLTAGAWIGQILRRGTASRLRKAFFRTLLEDRWRMRLQ